MGAAIPGTKLGRYQVIKHLASGGMAEVLLARAMGIEGFTRHVVIKRIRPHQADNPHFVQMFLNEARLAAQLHHQNIVQVHDIGQEGDEYFFAMEYVHGEDLRRVLTNVARRKDQVPLEHVVAIVTACAVALHHAHEQLGPDRKPLSIVHRDVSPANILVGYDGQIKLVDFGIAKAAATTHEATVAGALKGKASYMAPEQCTGKGGIDRRTDVFALGIVLYELATARRLFKGASDFLTMSAIVAGNVPPPRSHRPDMPEALEAIILKALALDPADRYQTAAEMSEALENFANTTRMRSSTTSLAAYMKHLFGERLEPWLVDEDAHIELTVDFDGSASGMAPPPTESVESNAIPETIEAMKSSPIMRARVKAATNAPPLAAVSTQKSGAVAKPRATTRQIAIPEAGAPAPVLPRRATRNDVPAPPAAPSRRKPITVQIPVAQQAAGAGPAIARTSTSGSLPGLAVEDAVPKDIDTSWDPSRPMAVADTAAVIAAPTKASNGAVASSAAFAATAPVTTNGANEPASETRSANLANGSNGAMNATSTAQDRSTAMSDAKAGDSNAKPASDVSTKSDPAIAAKPASTVGTKSDPAIAVKTDAPAAKPASTKSDPAIQVAASSPSRGDTTVVPKGDPTPVPRGAAPARGDTTPIPKGDPTPVPKADGKLSPNAFGRSSAASGPAVSRTSTPLPSMSKPAASATATDKAASTTSPATKPVGGDAAKPAITSVGAKPGDATTSATSAASSPSAPASSSTAPNGTGAGSAVAAALTAAGAPPAAPAASSAAAAPTASSTSDASTTVASTAPTTDAAADGESKADPATTPSSTSKPKLPAPRRAKLPGVADVSEPRIAGADKLEANAAKSDAATTDAVKTDAAKTDAATTDAAKTDAAASDTAIGAGDSPFAAPPKDDDSPFAAPAKSDDDAGPLSALLAAKPAAATAKADTDGDDIAARFAANAPMGAAVAVPAASMTLSDDVDDGAFAAKSPGFLATLKAQPKKVAIAAGALVLLIVVIVMATGGDKKSSQPSAGPDKTAETEKNKALGEDTEKPSPVENPGAEPAVAGSGETPTETGSAAPTGEPPTTDTTTDTGSADSGSASMPPPDTIEPPTTDTTAIKPVTTKPVTKTATKKPAPKPVATKTTTKTATKTAAKTPPKTTTKATAKTVAKKPATATKTTKPAVKPTTKCDPKSLFPCKKK